MTETNTPSEMITFLGTGGARFMMIRQLLASGGFWMNLNGTEILVDPGPGCIVQATKRKFNPEKLSAIILSHRHLDHSADINIMTEAMTHGGFRKHGRLFVPSDALGEEPVVFSYLRESLEGVEILQAGKSFTIGEVSFTTPFRHIHQVETYGMVFRTAKHTFSYITDTRYSDGLLRHYGSQLLIMNVVFLEPRPPAQPPAGPTDHLSIPDIERIVTELKPRAAIITHFGMTVWRNRPWEIARQLTEKTGIEVIAAKDGMKFDLAQLD